MHARQQKLYLLLQTRWRYFLINLGLGLGDEERAGSGEGVVSTGGEGAGENRTWRSRASRSYFDWTVLPAEAKLLSSTGTAALPRSTPKNAREKNIILETIVRNVGRLVCRLPFKAELQALQFCIYTNGILVLWLSKKAVLTVFLINPRDFV